MRGNVYKLYDEGLNSKVKLYTSVYIERLARM